MSIEKSQFKVLIANDLGSDIEDRYEATLRSAYQLEGASEALKQSALKVPSQLAAKVDTIFKEGIIKDGMTALAVVELLKKYLGKSGEFLAHLSIVEAHKAQALHAEARGIKVAMGVIAKMREKEIEQMETTIAFEEARQAAITRGEEPPPAPRGAARPSGVRPGPSQASQRKSAEVRAREANGTLADRRAAAKVDKSNGEKPIDEMNEAELEAYLTK